MDLNCNIKHTLNQTNCNIKHGKLKYIYQYINQYIVYKSTYRHDIYNMLMSEAAGVNMFSVFDFQLSINTITTCIILQLCI